MNSDNVTTILCISSYEKGAEFMRQCKREGCRVILLTSQSLEQAEWPRESIDEIFFIPDVDKQWNMNDVIYSVSYLARTEKIDRIVALDDFDVEKAAALREHLRISGMGDTTARYFRDKLAMRMRADEVGILVPDYIHILNYDRVKEFLKNIKPPYVLKPRLQAGAIGIKKIFSSNELWNALEKLGDEQSFYLLEKYVPGKIFHVDSIIYKHQVQFALSHEYGLPPMEVAHQGRVFNSRTMERNTHDEKNLQLINRQVLNAMGLKYGVSHTEFIKGKENGRIYFLETSARVGGAHIAELVEAGSGINLWAEWAKIEVSKNKGGYKLPLVKKDYAGLLLSLAKQEWPDMSEYNDPEIVWKIKKRHHAGIIIKASEKERVEKMLMEYIKRFYDDFFASEPMKDKPTN